MPTLAFFIYYAFIFYSIFLIQLSDSQSKAFGTCSSHLMAVGIFFASITFMYFKPPSSNTLEQNKVCLVFYSTVIPMLNPLIYSLRNRDVKKAFWKVLVKKLFLALGFYKWEKINVFKENMLFCSFSLVIPLSLFNQVLEFFHSCAYLTFKYIFSSPYISFVCFLRV